MDLAFFVLLLLGVAALPALIAFGVVQLTQREGGPSQHRTAARMFPAGVLLVAWILLSMALLPWFFPFPQLVSLAMGLRFGLASRGASWAAYPAVLGLLLLVSAISLPIAREDPALQLMTVHLVSHFFGALLSFSLARHFPRELTRDAPRRRVFLTGGLAAVVVHTALALVAFLTALLLKDGKVVDATKGILMAVDFPLALFLSEGLVGTQAADYLNELGEVLDRRLPGLRASIPIFLLGFFGALWWFMLGGIAGLVAGRNWLPKSMNKCWAAKDSP